MQVLYPGRTQLEFGDVGFYGGRKTGDQYLEKTLGIRREPTTNLPTYGTRPEIEPGVQALSPLRHPCSPKFQTNYKFTKMKLDMFPPVL